ncbi:hypothetical protein FVQ98_13980 [Ottowia sp. GY511]|uniref:Uncharacterized protein n=1 Tax=Ottowia flava TaxID=2675430 RepID=A0ABW4KQ01_9BURK|nr:hypothetical protein [Ottowia sp. GY511]TXK26482.1 hypothetical protein FVQ98_13980 [Ottowia sp. GY511]
MTWALILAFARKNWQAILAAVLIAAVGKDWPRAARAVNGGTHGLEERARLTKIAARALGVSL